MSLHDRLGSLLSANEVVVRAKRRQREQSERALELVTEFGILANASEHIALELSELGGVPAGALASAHRYAAEASKLASALLDYEVVLRAHLGASAAREVVA